MTVLLLLRSPTGPATVTGAAALTGTGTQTVAGVRTQRPWLTANFEKGTNGATIGTGDAGDASVWETVNIGASGTLIYDTTHAHRSTQSAKVQTAGAAVDMLWTTTFGALLDHYGRLYIYLTANPSADLQLIRTGGGGAQVVLLSTGKVAAVDSLSGATASAGTISLNQWVRLEWHIVHNTSTGSVEVKIFNSPDSTTATETVTRSGVNTGSAPSGVFFGNVNGNTNGPFWIDHPAARAQSYPGPINSADLTGTGSLTAAGTRTRFGVAALTGTGTLSSTGIRTRLGAAALSGAGSLTAAGDVTSGGGDTVTGAAALTGTGTLSATGAKILTGASALTGTGTLSAAGGLLITGAGTLTGSSTLTAAGSRVAVGVSPLTGLGTLTAAGSHTAIAAAALAGASTLTADGDVTAVINTEPTGHILRFQPGHVDPGHTGPITHERAGRITRPLAGSKI